MFAMISSNYAYHCSWNAGSASALPSLSRYLMIPVASISLPNFCKTRSVMVVLSSSLSVLITLPISYHQILALCDLRHILHLQDEQIGSVLSQIDDHLVSELFQNRLFDRLILHSHQSLNCSIVELLCLATRFSRAFHLYQSKSFSVFDSGNFFHVNCPALVGVSAKLLEHLTALYQQLCAPLIAAATSMHHEIVTQMRQLIMTHGWFMHLWWALLGSGFDEELIISLWRSSNFQRQLFAALDSICSDSFQLQQSPQLDSAPNISAYTLKQHATARCSQFQASDLLSQIEWLCDFLLCFAARHGDILRRLLEILLVESVALRLLRDLCVSPGDSHLLLHLARVFGSDSPVCDTIQKMFDDINGVQFHMDDEEEKKFAEFFISPAWPQCLAEIGSISDSTPSSSMTVSIRSLFQELEPHHQSVMQQQSRIRRVQVLPQFSSALLQYGSAEIHCLGCQAIVLLTLFDEPQSLLSLSSRLNMPHDSAVFVIESLQSQGLISQRSDGMWSITMDGADQSLHLHLPVLRSTQFLGESLQTLNSSSSSSSSASRDLRHSIDSAIVHTLKHSRQMPQQQLFQIMSQRVPLASRESISERLTDLISRDFIRCAEGDMLVYVV